MIRSSHGTQLDLTLILLLSKPLAQLLRNLFFALQLPAGKRYQHSTKTDNGPIEAYEVEFSPEMKEWASSSAPESGNAG